MLNTLKNIFNTNEPFVFIYIAIIVFILYGCWIYFQMIMKNKSWKMIKENATSLLYVILVTLAMFYWTLT